MVVLSELGGQLFQVFDVCRRHFLYGAAFAVSRGKVKVLGEDWHRRHDKNRERIYY